ncbi:helix-turn-helix domain-containing protein [Cohnella sp. CFH 77786]|nr:helix-turn-helix domain-containing protein [Cohnella sp. CFH 77786]
MFNLRHCDPQPANIFSTIFMCHYPLLINLQYFARGGCSEVMTTFGTRLKQARKSKRLTQNEVAEQLGIDFTTVSKYENNKSQPDNEKLRELAGLYEVSLDWLLTGRIGEGISANRLWVNGQPEELTDEEALHLLESLEMFRLLKAKRKKSKAAAGQTNPEI